MYVKFTASSSLNICETDCISCYTRTRYEMKGTWSKNIGS